jgi:hypothetical protein
MMAQITKVSDVLKTLMTPIPKREKAEHLLMLPPESRALVVAGWYERRLEGVPADEIDDESQRVARSLEETMDEMPDGESTATMHAMLDAGDIDIALNMVRGNAGQLSSTVAHLTSEHLIALFTEDPDQEHKLTVEGDLKYTDSVRMITLMYTLTVEVGERLPSVEEFLHSLTGKTLLNSLRWSAQTDDEDAQEILRFLEDTYGMGPFRFEETLDLEEETNSTEE